MKARVRRLLLVLAAAALLLDGGLLLAERLGAASLPEEDTAYFLDVGEGDCTLLVSGGSTVLVDAGTPEGAPALVRELKSLGVRRLDAVIATHPHADHIGGMEAVLRAFPVRSFYMSAETQSDALDAALRRRRLTPLVPYDGETLTLKGGASLTFLGPAEDIPADRINDRSLITLFQTGSASVLLMGDAEEPAEQSLLRHRASVRYSEGRPSWLGYLVLSCISLCARSADRHHILRHGQRLRSSGRTNANQSDTCGCTRYPHDRGKRHGRDPAHRLQGECCMKKTGIIDHFEGDYIYVEIGEDTVKIPREGAPAMLAEGTVVIVEDGRIVDVDEIETQRMENDMRRRFERILGAKSDV